MPLFSKSILLGPGLLLLCDANNCNSCFGFNLLCLLTLVLPSLVPTVPHSAPLQLLLITRMLFYCCLLESAKYAGPPAFTPYSSSAMVRSSVVSTVRVSLVLNPSSF